MITTILLELTVSALIVYGFMHEDKVIEFEQAIKRIVVSNCRRAIRLMKPKLLTIKRIVIGNYRRFKRFVEVAK